MQSLTLPRSIRSVTASYPRSMRRLLSSSLRQKRSRVLSSNTLAGHSRLLVSRKTTYSRPTQMSTRRMVVMVSLLVAELSSPVASLSLRITWLSSPRSSRRPRRRPSPRPRKPPTLSKRRPITRKSRARILCHPQRI